MLAFEKNITALITHQTVFCKLTTALTHLLIQPGIASLILFFTTHLNHIFFPISIPLKYLKWQNAAKGV